MGSSELPPSPALPLPALIFFPLPPTPALLRWLNSCDNTRTGLLPIIGMPRLADLQDLNVENPPQAQNERIDQSPAAVRRRRVRYFKRADGWFNRFVRLAVVVHEGFWLGCLSADDLNAITTEHNEHSRESASGTQLARLFDWELVAVRHHFPPASRVLVAAGGEGGKCWHCAAPATRRTDSNVIRRSCEPALLYSRFPSSRALGVRRYDTFVPDGRSKSRPSSRAEGVSGTRGSVEL